MCIVPSSVWREESGIGMCLNEIPLYTYSIQSYALRKVVHVFDLLLQNSINTRQDKTNYIPCRLLYMYLWLTFQYWTQYHNTVVCMPIIFNVCVLFLPNYYQYPLFLCVIISSCWYCIDHCNNYYVLLLVYFIKSKFYVNACAGLIDHVIPQCSGNWTVRAWEERHELHWEFVVRV